MREIGVETEATDLGGPGTYALLFRSSSAALRVGALGEVALREGFAVYVGSAFGPGGLAGRLRHHLKPVSRPHWHLDYLRPALELRGAWIGAGPRHVEHEWASIFADVPSASIPLARFGASDCRCASHLFHWRRAPGRRRTGERLRAVSAARSVEFMPAKRLVSLVLPAI